MNKKYDSLIPFDDLHWCKKENRFVALSDDEYHSIILACYESGMELGDIEQLEKVIKWAESIKIGSVLLRRVLDGSVSVFYDSEFDEPMFLAKDNIKDKTND